MHFHEKQHYNKIMYPSNYCSDDEIKCLFLSSLLLKQLLAKALAEKMNDLEGILTSTQIIKWLISCLYSLLNVKEKSGIL